MSEPRQRVRLLRIALNEAAFRRLNEEIYGPGKRAEDLPEYQIVCECGAESCETTLTVDADVYREVRAHSGRFLVKTGHEIPDAETVVERRGDVGVVEKLPGEARQVVAETDPRADP